MSLGKTQPLAPPRIFISHTWEEKDKALTHVLEKALREAGAEVWVDHAGIRGGDNLPKQINDALDWCNTLVLVWSKAAIASHWVELEWTNAISLQKRIIPCPHDGTPLPSILANKAYISFANEAEGLRQLFAALQLAPPSREAQDAVVAPASVPHPPVIQTPPSIPKPSPKKPALIQLRRTPVNPLSVDAVQQMLRDKDFFDDYKNKSGKGIQHHYESVERQGVKLVIDRATSLTWQQSGSEKYMSFKETEAYVRQLNVDKHGGHTDWRLPTLEEAMSLMEREKKNGELYLDPVFDKTQWWIWTADLESAGRAWVVFFTLGSCNHGGSDDYVRAVRS
jgi:hypothetical protein